MPSARDLSEPCVKCGGVRKRSPAGQVYCEDCNRRYREENRERNRKRDLEYHARNRDVALERMKAYNKGERKQRAPGREPNEYIRDWRKKGDEGSRHPDYGIYSKIKDRCYNPNSPDAKNYQIDRKITMCDRWKDSFWSFLEDMGPRPDPRSKYSIERLDNDGNYEPGNCIWATRIVQNNNTRRNIANRLARMDTDTIFYKDRYMTLKEFSEFTGLHLVAVKSRYTQHPLSIDWILSEDVDLRLHEWKGRKYNLSELSYISGITYPVMRGRIIIAKWTVEKAMTTEVVKRGT